MKVNQNFTSWDLKKITPNTDTLTSGWAENLDFWIWIDQAFFTFAQKLNVKKVKTQAQKTQT